MRAFTTPLLAALLVAAAVSPATAAPPHKSAAAAAPPAGDLVSSDVRCLITMAALGQDKTRQQAAVIGAYFFAGRLSARAPGLNVPAAIKAQEAQMNPQQLPAEAQRCGPMVQAAMQSLATGFAPPPGAQTAPGAKPPTASPAPTAPAPAPTPAPK